MEIKAQVLSNCLDVQALFQNFQIRALIKGKWNVESNTKARMSPFVEMVLYYIALL
jgi:hypothetical protein